MAEPRNSIVGDVQEDGTIKYKCLEKDFNIIQAWATQGKVPTYSTCYVADTTEMYMYEKTTDRWLPQ